MSYRFGNVTLTLGARYSALRRNYPQSPHPLEDTYLSPTHLSELCPLCFHREQHDNRLCIGSIDGNFQHRRMKRAAMDSFDEIETPMFTYSRKAPTELPAPVPEKDTKTNTCTHFFNALNEKPPSMKGYDETGLLGMVCRHGSPLRYLNLYEGERMESTYTLLKDVVLQTPYDTQWGLMYDVGCRFQQWLQRRDAELSARMTVRTSTCICGGGVLNKLTDQTQCLPCICP